jgi:hypothetical protein
MDGQTWSESVVVGPAHTDAGPPDRGGRIFGDLLFTEEARMVRYRGLDTDGNEIAIPGLTFTYINAKAGPRLSDVTASSLNPSSNRPPIIAREEWGAERAYGGADRGEVEWPPSYQTVRHVIIHHSDTPRFRDPLVEIRSIHYYHAITRGWGDIGYNYLVDYMGNVYEGRVGGENAIGGHAFQYAHGSAGICSMGNFSLETSTPEAIAGLTWITSWAGRDLDPLSQRDFHAQSANDLRTPGRRQQHLSRRRIIRRSGDDPVGRGRCPGWRQGSAQRSTVQSRTNDRGDGGRRQHARSPGYRSIRRGHRSPWGRDAHRRRPNHGRWIQLV